MAHALLDIWSLIGPPCLLQADNGREFSNIAASSRASSKSSKKKGSDDPLDDTGVDVDIGADDEVSHLLHLLS